MNDNSLISFHGLCKRQDENFVTESFVHLLKMIIDIEPHSAVPLLKYITNGNWEGDNHAASLVEINTQVAIDAGRPDIEIKDAKHLIFIEVKVESDFGETQIERYSSYLGEVKDKKTAFITLTKYPVRNVLEVDGSVRWYDMHSMLLNIKTESDVLLYIINQFINFMLYRGLFMDSVTWEMPSGVKSFKNLMGMIGENLSNTNYRCKKAVAWEWVGFYIDDSKYWVGIILDNPNIILFHTESLVMVDNLKVDKGVVFNSRWENRIDLSGENEHFFARSKVSQMSLIEDFLKSSIQFAESLSGESHMPHSDS